MVPQLEEEAVVTAVLVGYLGLVNHRGPRLFALGGIEAEDVGERSGLHVVRRVGRLRRR